MRFPLAFAFSLLLLAPVAGQDLVAKTDALAPADAQKAFKLPKGFEIQLIAAEPDIQKPMQMAFDTKGRLWVTTSHHYPWAAKPGEGTDRLYVLSDFDEKGKAKSIKIFDEKLNIPIGVLPLEDGKSVIVSECGSILKLTDTDGDGKADQREVLFTGFGFKDTHGMTNSFTPMPDGWIYATHGFSNDSKAKGKDGHEVVMNSGNTFRFKADGSRIEVFTRGQVNPFGIAVDPWGNIYTACCHSKPITQLIRGAHYDSFGKPHDGLGYGPHVVNHQHGSTGLCGLAWGAGPMFPKEWDGVMFLGNCVTNRINCDRIEWKGSTPVGKELPDFLSTTDAWFRPVDLKFGPDGALYVSDFYNKIIGHYEVDLKHPGRDNLKGRLWRIVYTGPKRTEKNFEADQLSEIEAMRKLTVEAKLNDQQRKSVIATLSGKPQAARAAVDVMIAQPNADFVKPLLLYNPKIPADDNHMRHAAKVALRNCVEAPDGWKEAVAAIPIPQTAEDGEKGFAPLVEAAFGSTNPKVIDGLQYSVMAKGYMRDADLYELGRRIGRYMPSKNWQPFLSDLESSPYWIRSVECIRAAGGLLRGIQESGQRIDDNSATHLNHITLLLSQALANPKSGYGEASVEVVREVKKLFPGPISPAWNATASSFAKQLNSTDPASTGRNIQYAEAAILIGGSRERDTVMKWLNGPAKADATIRERLLLVILGQKPAVNEMIAARDLLATAPYSLASRIAFGLGGDKFGGELLMLAIEKGECSPRVLQEKPIADRLHAHKSAEIESKFTALTKNLPAPEKRIDELIKKRGEGFKNFKSDLAKGKEVFTKNCANCHQVNNEGAKVGPQLDGIGIRGLERLLEDTLDPSRNVDAAFKSTTLILLDGRALSGLVRVDGAVYVQIDNLGKENRINAKDVDKVVKSNLSSMPANVDAIIPESDYYHLLAFLLSQRPK